MTVTRGVIMAACLGAIGSAGCVGPAAKTAESAVRDDTRPYLLERVDDVAVVQLYADGFESLPLNEKILIYHLAQAAVAGRDIFIDQKYAHALELRDLLEEIWIHRDGIPADTQRALERTLKLFWINNGPHNAITGRKNVLTCSFEAFAEAARVAERAGARLPRRPGESLEQMLARVRPWLFDETVDTQVTNKNPQDGRDILQASANHLYEGVSLADLEGFEERYPLNATLVKRPDGRLEEDVWRAGFDDVVPPGRYAERIEAVIAHLEAAIPYATPRMARALGALIHCYRTGDPVDRRAYDIAWVADTDSPVDTINGFIEVYLDPRGRKGAWEALVYFNDPEKMHLIETIARHAQWFENHMPYDARYRKPEVKGISAKAITVVIETGDSGPVGPIGINLPNDQDVRTHYGSKSVSLGNVIEAYDRASSRQRRREFCYDEAEFQRLERFKRLTLDLEVNMHEVIGHASGRVSDTLQGSPEDHLKETYSALEEARADLVALWFIGDPILVELGLVDADDLADVQRTAYEEAARTALSQLRRVRVGTTLEEDHMRNRQLIVHWLMDHTDAIAVRRRDDKTFYVVTDVDAFQAGVGCLLAEVQRIKSEGDYPAARDLMERYGIHFDPALRDEVVARWDRLDEPAYTGFVMPELTAVRDERGRIVDVTISAPLSLEDQMLRWSGRR